MEVLIPFDQLPLLLEAADDGLIRLLDESALVVPHLGGEPAFIVHGTNRGNSRTLQGVVVVLAETRGGVDDAGTVFGG